MLQLASKLSYGTSYVCGTLGVFLNVIGVVRVIYLCPFSRCKTLQAVYRVLFGSKWSGSGHDLWVT